MFFQYCAAFGDYKLDEMNGLVPRILAAGPHLAVSYALQAAAAAAEIDERSPSDDERRRLRRLAYDSARTAQEMNPTSPFIKAFVDYLYATIDDPERGMAERERLFRRSLEAAPTQYAFYRYGYLLDAVGRKRDALGVFERFATSFPLEGATGRASRLAEVGRIDVARELFKADHRIWPTDSYVVSNWFWAEFWYGDPKIAEELARHPGTVTGNRPRLDTRALGCFDAVLEARSRKAILKVTEIQTACPSGTEHLDGIYAYFGHVDAAYRIAIENHGFTDPFAAYMRPVRADPRFMSLVARPPLVEYWTETGRWPDFCASEKLPYDCKEAARLARTRFAK